MIDAVWFAAAVTRVSGLRRRDGCCDRLRLARDRWRDARFRRFITIAQSQERDDGERNNGKSNTDLQAHDDYNAEAERA